jgi:hypothetical protein
MEVKMDKIVEDVYAEDVVSIIDNFVGWQIIGLDL